MHRKPDILPIAPDMVSQPDGHRWRALGATLAQALVRHPKVVEADHEPDLPAVARVAPGQTPRAAPQGGDEPPQCAIPSFHERCLDRRAELPETQLLDEATRTTEDHAPADLHDMATRVADLDDLGVEQVFGGDEPWFRLAPHLPPPSAAIDDAQHVEQRRAIGFPAIGEKDRHLPHAGDDLGYQRSGLLLRARADVDPEQKPTPHRQGGMDPGHLAWTEFRMGFIHLHPGHVHPTDNLAMVGLGTLGCHLLQAVHGFEIHRTNVSGALITDAPPLTFHQPYDGLFGELTAGHQGALPFRELPVACRTAQPFDVLVRPCPRPMRDVAFTRTIELRTLWIRTRESRISLLDWRRQCHSGPPLSRIGPKDIDLTPVFPRYYSPGLPVDVTESFLERVRRILDSETPAAFDPPIPAWKILEGKGYPDMEVQEIVTRFHQATEAALARIQLVWQQGMDASAAHPRQIL